MSNILRYTEHKMYQIIYMFTNIISHSIKITIPLTVVCIFLQHFVLLNMRTLFSLIKSIERKVIKKEKKTFSQLYTTFIVSVNIILFNGVKQQKFNISVSNRFHLICN